LGAQLGGFRRGKIRADLQAPGVRRGVLSDCDLSACGLAYLARGAVGVIALRHARQLDAEAPGVESLGPRGEQPRFQAHARDGERRGRRARRGRTQQPAARRDGDGARVRGEPYADQGLCVEAGDFDSGRGLGLHAARPRLRGAFLREGGGRRRQEGVREQ
jgi:hypothetical protein